MRTINIKIIASVLFFTFGILFFSLAVQKYRILTGSRASLNLPQCEIPEGGSVPSNAPCASCSIFSDTAIDENGDVNVEFGCQVVCNDSDNPLDTTGCPSGLLPYSISETSWYWCKESGDHACTSQNELTGDLITNVESAGFTDGGPWIMSRQGDTNFSASFNVPGYESCGRVQVDVETNQKYSYVINSDQDCENDIVAGDLSANQAATPTLGFGFTDENPTNTPFVQQPTIPPPTVTKTPTPIATNTSVPTHTTTPTIRITTSITPTISTTPAITGSITPTGKLSPSPSPTLTYTPTPTPSPTATATPTFTPVPTFTPMPAPVSDISVDGQSPGASSWLMMLVPAALVMLGLFL